MNNTKDDISNEQRKTNRRHLIYYLRVIDRDTEQPIGFLVDITTKGMMVMSESAIEPDKNYHLKILLQTELSQRKYLNFDAKSKWCRNSINTDFYDTGFELLDVDVSDFREIEDIIDALGFKN